MAVAHWWQTGILAPPAVAGSVRASPALPTLIVRGPVGTWGRQEAPPEGAGAEATLKGRPAESAADGPLLIKKNLNTYLFIQIFKLNSFYIRSICLKLFHIFSILINLLTNLFVSCFIKLLEIYLLTFIYFSLSVSTVYIMLRLNSVVSLRQSGWIEERIL